MENTEITQNQAFMIENSHNGIVKTINDQFKTAKFETVKEAKNFIKHIVKFQSAYNYDFKGQYFQIFIRLNEEEYKNIGKRINA